MEVVQNLLGGDARALARAISRVEADTAAAAGLVRAAYPHTGRATVIGITGPPGSGKSSLVDRLVASVRGDGRRVGVVAVDPSSAYSGGAILGDRIRMQGHATDPGVFIRSMATRGHLGGLSRTASDAVDLMDAAGYDPIFIETVGVGQDEIEVARAADVVAVVLVPGMGDDIQAIKAGILEIADVFVINKSDRPGADRLAADLDFMMSLASEDLRPRPEIIHTVAVEDQGVLDLKEGIARFVAAAGETRKAERRRERAAARFLALLSERLLGRVLEEALPGEAVRRLVIEITERRTDPYTAVEDVLDRVEVR